MTRILLLGDTPAVHIARKRHLSPIDSHVYNPRATDLVPELDEYTHVIGDAQNSEVVTILNEASRRGLRTEWL